MTLIKTACLALVVAGCLVATKEAGAVVELQGLRANTPAHCQAFTPGATNTVRNRVVGSENVGATMNVACTFEKGFSIHATPVTLVEMWFSNNATSGSVTINCTLLTGSQGWAGAVVINKSVSIAAGPGQDFLQFSAGDTADPGDTSLGSELVGVNCTLPPHAVINDTYIYWNDEDGVGT